MKDRNEKPITEEELLQEPIPTIDPATILYEDLDGLDTGSRS